MDRPKDVVRRGYDLVSTKYRRPDFEFERSGYAAFLGWVNRDLRPGACVLDIGCGCGIPTARELVRVGCEVVGVDISLEQVRRAREFVPDATFLCKDIMDADFKPESFDLVVAFYSIINIPLEEHETLVSQIGRWMRPNGRLLCTVGDQKSPGYFVDDWLGVAGARMFWSHADLDTYRQWVSAAGLKIEREELLVDSGGTRHPVILAQKTSKSPHLD